MRITNPTILTAIAFGLLILLQLCLLIARVLFIVLTLGNTDFPLSIEIKE